MRRLRTSLAPLLIAVAVIAAAEFGVRMLAPHLPDPVTWDSPWVQEKARQIGDAGRPAEVVFAGSSVVQSAIDPTLFDAAIGSGITSYNAGIPGATVRVWREWLRDVVAPGLCPAVVVAGVSIRDYNDANAGGRMGLTRYLRSEGRRAHLGEASLDERVDDAVAHLSAFYRYRSVLRRPADVATWLLGGSVEGWRRMELTPAGRNVAFDDHTYRLDPDRREAIRTTAFADFAVGDEEEQALRRIVRDARDRGAIAVILEMPVMESDLAPLLPRGADDFADFKASLDRVARRLDVPLVRLDALVDRPGLFADEYHVNGAGSHALTTALADALAPIIDAAGSADCTRG